MPCAPAGKAWTWLGAIRQELQDLSDRVAEETGRAVRRLDALGQQVEDALRKLEESPSELPDGVVQSLPWARMRSRISIIEKKAAPRWHVPCPSCSRP